MLRPNESHVTCAKCDGYFLVQKPPGSVFDCPTCKYSRSATLPMHLTKAQLSTVESKKLQYAYLRLEDSFAKCRDKPSSSWMLGHKVSRSRDTGPMEPGGQNRPQTVRVEPHRYGGLHNLPQD
jgi:hypothetical protein